jgi:hypothetical protein
MQRGLRSGARQLASQRRYHRNTVAAINNTTVSESLAEQRLAERLAAIEATWGPLFDNAPRLAP